MNTRLASLLEYFASKFWLIPTAIALSLLGTAAILCQNFETELPGFLGWLVFGTSAPDGARQILTTIGTASMTVVGVLFSITIVVLQQVSTQYTPRIIENFIRSTASQVVLGFYVGTFGYCLLLLTEIRGEPNSNLSPFQQLGINLAIALALVCLALLIYYIQSIAKSIRSNQILKSIRHETIRSIRVMESNFKNRKKVHPSDRQGPGAETKRSMIVSPQSGYLQSIHFEHLGKVLKGHEVVIYPEALVGDYIYAENELMQIEASKALDEKLKNEILKVFKIGLARTHLQDFRFGIRQTVDIAIRALSPGINDLSTAIESVNELGTILSSYLRTQEPPDWVELCPGVRMKVKKVPFEDLLRLAFDQIVLSGQEFNWLLLRIRDVLRHLATVAVAAEKQEHKILIKNKEAEVVRLLEEKRGPFSPSTERDPNQGLTTQPLSDNQP